MQASEDKRGKCVKLKPPALIRFDSGFLYSKVKSKEGLSHRKNRICSAVTCMTAALSNE